MQRAMALALIQRAQEGDEDAHRQVAIFVFEKYRGRLRPLYSQDPAVSLEDMEMTFFEGIWAHVLKADHRGDPLYHIGQRGYWRVQSEVRAAKSLMSKRQPPVVFDGFDEDDHPRWIETIADPSEDAREVLFRHDEATHRVRAIFDAPISIRAREAVERALSGEAGDPTEPGFNQRLARAMNLSPQRVSQLFNELREAGA